MPFWLSLLILAGAGAFVFTGIQNIAYELRFGHLRPRLLFWTVPGWTSDRAASPSAYWFGILFDCFRTMFFGALVFVAVAYAAQEIDI